jgi:cytoskeleton protein RodZ
MSLDEEKTATEEQPSSGLGEMLSQAREAAGYTQQDVATELHLKPELIRAMDDERFEELPEPAYVRGYLRSYARLIGLEPERVLDAYSALNPEVPEWEFNEPARHEVAQGRNLAPVTFIIFVVIAGLLVTWLLTEGNGNNKESEVIVETAEAPEVSEVAPVDVIEAPAMSSEDASQPETPAEVETPAPLIEEAEVKQEPLVLEPESAEEITIVEDSLEDFTLASVQAEGTDKVVLTFSNESWAEVFDANGVQLLRGLMKKNTVQELSGTAPFSVFLGNTPAVEIRINDVEFDATPYTRRDSVSRFTLKAP